MDAVFGPKRLGTPRMRCANDFHAVVPQVANRSEGVVIAAVGNENPQTIAPEFEKPFFAHHSAISLPEANHAPLSEQYLRSFS